MTHSQIDSLRISDVFNRIIIVGYNRELKQYYISIGPAKYYEFSEAQALLNDLDRHIQ
jgi:hypothetical protein